MPPKVRFQQIDIINAAFELTRKNGLDAINARSVACEIGCSTQPIFRVFENMEQLKNAVFERSAQLFQNRLDARRSDGESAYKTVGMVYLVFAMQEPHLFRLLFLNKHGKNLEGQFNIRTHVTEELMQKGGFNKEQADLIHHHMKVYVTGLATSLSVGTVSLSEEKIDELLCMEYRAIVSYLIWDGAKDIAIPV